MTVLGASVVSGLSIALGILTFSQRTLINILIGWLLTPANACFIAVALYFGVNLRFRSEF